MIFGVYSIWPHSLKAVRPDVTEQQKKRLLSRAPRPLVEPWVPSVIARPGLGLQSFVNKSSRIVTRRGAHG